METQLLQFVDLTRVPFALGVVVVAWLANRFLARSVDDLGARFTERRLLFKQLGSFARFVILIVTGLLVIAAVVRFSNEVLITIGGSVAVAVGFAFKDLLASLMAGIILLVDRPFQVGDRVEFGGQYGEVVEIGLRTVRINTLDDNLISVPNSRFLTESVSCANAGALDQMCVFEFFVGCREDFDLAKDLVYDAVASSNYVFLAKPIVVHVREVPVPNSDKFAVKVWAKAYVFDGRFESAFATDVQERAHRAFRAYGVKTAGWLNDGSGKAPAAA
jgi:small-conductance mechanosensitive channel